MPPINQQGSRTGLITALVVFVILFVVSLVFAFNFYGKYQQAVVNLDREQKNYSAIVSESALTSTPVTQLAQAKSESPGHFQIVNSPSTTAMDVALAQRTGLLAVIAGPGSDQPAGATADAAGTEVSSDAKQLADAKVPVDLSTGGLVGAVHRLTQAVLDARHEVAAAKDQLAATQKQVQAVTASVAQVNTTKDTAAADAAAQAKQALDGVQQTVDAQKATVDQLTDTQHKAIALNETQANDLNGRIADLTRQNQQKDKQYDAVRAKLEPRRRYVDDAAIRPADGKLIRVPGGGVCYINLGYGSGVSNGLTFEVYDKLGGVPPLPKTDTGDEQLPIGKASIEVIHVGNDSSECRIVHTAPGLVLSEGDPIANLVFDPHQKYQFYVFGNFDLANTGRPVTSDAEVIKRLVSQWGGKLADHITPDTDFVVLGSEPVIPEFSKDDLTPENQQKVTDATAALERYQSVRQEAKDLHIPVLNQNRFLYYVGYYDQATR